MKKCSYCGCVTNDEVKFCPECGKRFDDTLNMMQSETRKEEINQTALLSLVFGVIGLALDLGIIGIVFSILAFSFGKKTKEESMYGKVGYYCGLVGIILASIIAVIIIIYIILITIGVITYTVAIE